VDGRDKPGHDGNRFLRQKRRPNLPSGAGHENELPADALAELGWESGDVIDLKVEAGCLRATRSMTKHDHAMAFARRAFKRYRKAFEILAKS
jgi:hypothetical protein